MRSAYIGLLFVVASYGDRTRRFGREAGWRHLIYPLSLAIYCTSWTFFGSVGLASRTGFDFLTIYLGPMLMIGLCSPLIMRIVRLAKAQNITSIADFIAARYGKAQTVAATVALIAIIGTIPYIALQLKAVSSSLSTILVHIRPESGAIQPVLGDISLLVALSMATFAVLFGTRHIDATEHQDGLMLAVATESMVKLFAFLAVGVFVTFWMFDGPSDLFARAWERPETAALLTHEPVAGTIAAMTLLSLFAIVLLPRQFHVTVVENNSEGEIRRAAWLFPLYLVLINLFVVPIALAGMLTFQAGQVDSDMFVLALPLTARSELFTLIAFVGGLSAATAMVIVESVALAIMVSNDIVMPLVLQRRESLISNRSDVGWLLLAVRRIAIFVILFLAYMYYRSAGDAQLAAIGLLSFAAIAQLAPTFFGGLIWRRATARGALAGMTIGIVVWAYTLLLPSFADAGIVGAHLLREGPWGLAFLRPQALMGIDLPPLVHGVLWSLTLNILAYVTFSFARAPASIERLQADLFVPTDLAPMTPSFRLWRSSVTVEELTTTVARYLGEERTRTSFDSYASTRGISADPKGEADFQLLRYAEHLLASAIGAASSRLVLSLLLRKRTVSTKAALKLLDDANAAIHYNREILQTALGHVRQGIAVFNKDLHLACWNRQFGEILDLPPQFTRVGTPLDEILRFNAAGSTRDPAAADALVRERIARYVSASEPFLERFPERDLIMEVRANHMPDGGIVTTFTDITPTVKAGEELERANESLERRVQERTEELTRLNTELARAKAEAEQANISKTRFLAAASHDILQPLNAARLYVTSLVERQGRGEDAQLVGNIDASLDAVEEILGRAARHFAARRRRAQSRDRRLPHRRADAPARGRVRAAGAGEGIAARLRAVLAGGEVRPAAAAAAAAEPGVERDQIHAQGPRAGRLPAPPRAAAHRSPRHRARHPALQAPGDLQGVSPPRPGRQGRARPRPRALDRGAHRARPRPQDRGRFDHRPRVAVLGGRSALRQHSRQGAAARTFDMDRGQLAGIAVLCIDNELAILDGMETLLGGWGCHVLKAPDLKSAIAALAASNVTPDALLVDYHLGDGNGIDAIAAAAPALRRRTGRHPDHRRPQPGRARGGPRPRHPGAQQADPARRVARAAGAMPRAAGGGGGVSARRRRSRSR